MIVFYRIILQWNKQNAMTDPLRIPIFLVKLCLSYYQNKIADAQYVILFLYINIQCCSQSISTLNVYIFSVVLVPFPSLDTNIG